MDISLLAKARENFYYADAYMPEAHNMINVMKTFYDQNNSKCKRNKKISKNGFLYRFK